MRTLVRIIERSELKRRCPLASRVRISYSNISSQILISSPTDQHTVRLLLPLNE